MINGTPGIGKSLFIIFRFIYITVAEAKASRLPIPTFVYSNRKENQFYLHFNTNNESVVSIYKLESCSTPNYFISDTIANETFSVSKLNIHVSSIHHDGNWKFRNSFHNESGQVISFPTFSFEEYQRCDGSLVNNQYVNTERLKFLFDIYIWGKFTIITTTRRHRKDTINIPFCKRRDGVLF